MSSDNKVNFKSQIEKFNEIKQTFELLKNKFEQIKETNIERECSDLDKELKDKTKNIDNKTKNIDNKNINTIKTQYREFIELYNNSVIKTQKINNIINNINNIINDIKESIKIILLSLGRAYKYNKDKLIKNKTNPLGNSLLGEIKNLTKNNNSRKGRDLMKEILDYIEDKILPVYLQVLKFNIIKCNLDERIGYEIKKTILINIMNFYSNIKNSIEVEQLSEKLKLIITNNIFTNNKINEFTGVYNIMKENIEVLTSIVTNLENLFKDNRNDFLNNREVDPFVINMEKYKNVKESYMSHINLLDNKLKKLKELMETSLQKFIELSYKHKEELVSKFDNSVNTIIDTVKNCIKEALVNLNTSRKNSKNLIEKLVSLLQLTINTIGINGINISNKVELQNNVSIKDKLTAIITNIITQFPSEVVSSPKGENVTGNGSRRGNVAQNSNKINNSELMVIPSTLDYDIESVNPYVEEKNIYHTYENFLNNITKKSKNLRQRGITQNETNEMKNMRDETMKKLIKSYNRLSNNNKSSALNKIQNVLTPRSNREIYKQSTKNAAKEFLNGLKAKSPLLRTTGFNGVTTLENSNSFRNISR